MPKEEISSFTTSSSCSVVITSAGAGAALFRSAYLFIYKLELSDKEPALISVITAHVNRIQERGRRLRRWLEVALARWMSGSARGLLHEMSEARVEMGLDLKSDDGIEVAAA